ncbi:hypothetical protein L1049_011272 [Liquidambar formosana]|uniref:Uncharacterized protein n=1 Tax=Liquidambar formosana TaxID=63359 RepID=A0AAP0WWX2_LIQFO
MASLTPGVLSKLLLNAGNKDVKVTGEHRSPLLQVIEIVPSLAAGGDDPWQSRGFFLKVSDSRHSAYVSISDEDVDLIYNDKIQLGQFVHVDRLDPGSPVPVVRGMKPVPRRRPCVGNPQDLVSSDSLRIRSTVDFSKPSKGWGGVSKSSARKDVGAKPNAAKSRRASFLGSARVEEGVELRRLSLDSARKAWDHGPARNTSHFKSKETSTSSSSHSASQVLSDKKASSKRDSSLKTPGFTFSPLKNKNDVFTLNLKSKPLEKDIKSSSEATIPSHLTKVPLSFKAWSDRKIFWDSLPPTIHDLGKEAVSRRNVAFSAAVHALEEASAAEGVIRCMSMFAELCESCQKDSAGPLVEQFLNLHQSMQKAAMVINSLLCTRLPDVKASTDCSSQHSLPEACKNFTSKNATSWVQAAMETDLSKFCLFRKQETGEILNGEKCHYVVLESTLKEMKSENHSPQNKQNSRNHGGFSLDGSAKTMQSASRRHLSKKMNIAREEWSKGSGLKEAASLSEKLLLVSRGWFLKYLEDSFDRGFGLRSGEGGPEISGLLGQLKRVNQWLNESIGNRIEFDERIEGLRKKLYGFLLEHVDSAVAAN